MKPHYSKLTVTPSDYLTGGVDLLKKTWQISYYFFDSDHPKGKQIRIKGMNRATTLADRRSITKQLIANETYQLEAGMNPITKTSGVYNKVHLTEDTPFIRALELAMDAVIVEHQTRLDIKSAILKIKKHAEEYTPISEVRKRDMVRILDQCGVSPKRYNKIKGYISILFAHLVKLEVIEHNFIRDIPNLRTVKNLRKVITKEEREKLYKLKESNYNFFRFIMIFFHSGARLTELLKLKVADCDLKNQYFTVTIKKGSYSKQQRKPITNEVLTYWKELQGEPDMYVFSEKLEPGFHPIRRDQVTRRWKTHCKDALGIESDLYSLKHAHADLISEQLGLIYTQNQMGHMSPEISKIYATKEAERRMEELKGLEVKL